MTSLDYVYDKSVLGSQVISRNLDIKVNLNRTGLLTNAKRAILQVRESPSPVCHYS